MKKHPIILGAVIALAGCTPVPLQQPYDAMLWCKPYFNDRVPQSKCDAAIRAYQNSTAVQEQQRKTNLCLREGAIYQSAASMRDSGMPPQQTLRTLSPMEQHGISEEFVKHAINQVYFDPELTNAGGPALGHQVANLCLHPNGTFTPLN
ncbi:hypothetical protein [Paraburkholderia tropica]|uniref:hypothetical protein n=1 Tax=Paraburkholderia tropica TaxID=92647 RepID=UPI003D275912